MKKGERTKQKLFDSAVQLFEKYEVNEVTVDAIVEAAGVAKGTFYIYFESKDALVAEYMRDYVSDLDAEYKAYLDLLPADTKASDMLLLLTEKIIKIIVDKIGVELMTTVYKMQLIENVNTDIIKDYNRALYKMFTDVLHKGADQGEFVTARSLDLLAKHLIMALRGLCYEWCTRYPDFDLKEQALAHFEIMLDGINVKTK